MHFFSLQSHAFSALLRFFSPFNGLSRLFSFFAFCVSVYKDTKKTVDLIFSRLTQNETIRQMYALWCKMEQTKHDVYSSARVNFPELTDNPEFKSVKNMIVKMVAGMNLTLPPEPELEIFDFEGEFISTDMAYKIEWSKEYKQACQLFRKKEKTKAEKQECLKLFTVEANAENVLALHDLGKLYNSDFLGEPDKEKSLEYYAKALKGFQDLEGLDSGMKSYIQYRIGNLYHSGKGVTQNAAFAVQWYTKAAENKNQWAEFQLGRIFLSGADGIEPDREKAAEWLILSAEHGNESAQKLLDNTEQYQNRILADTAFSLFMNLSRIIEEDYDHTEQKLRSQVDSKLRRIIQKKKQVLGIRNEHLSSQNY